MKEMKDYDFEVRKLVSTEKERQRQKQQLSKLRKRALELLDELAEYRDVVDRVSVCAETGTKIAKLTSDYKTIVQSMARIYEFTVKRYSVTEWEQLKNDVTQNSKPVEPQK